MRFSYLALGLLVFSALFMARTGLAGNVSTIIAKGIVGVPDLQIAAASDAALSERLQILQSKSFEDFLDPNQDIEEAINLVIFNWYGVDNLDPTSRGPNIDARQLGVLEKINGERFVQTGAGGEKNPLFWAALALHDAYHIFYKNIFAQITAQTMAHDLFIGNMAYTHAGDGGIIGIRGLNQERISQAVRATQGMKDEGDKYRIWRRIYLVIDNALGIEYLPENDQAYLYAAVRLSGLNWLDLKEKSQFISVSDAPGASFADKVLGMTVSDCSIIPLYKQARSLSKDRQIVMSNLITAMFKKCGDKEKAVVAAFKKAGFSVTEVSQQNNQRELFGDRKPYDRIYSALELTRMNQLRRALFLPYDGYYAFIYVRGDSVEHISAHVQRANIN